MVILNNKNLQINTKDFYKTVFALVIPIALQNLINVGVTSADVIMLGRVNEIVLSAASLGGQVQFVMTLFFFGLTSGAAVLTAQYWGKKDTLSIEKVLGISLKFSLIVSLIFTLVTFLFPSEIMRLFSSEEAVIAEGTKYLRIVCFSYIFSSITLIYLNIMRTLEKVIISTVVFSISLLINVIFNYIFIFGAFSIPSLGIAGAALSTLIARIIETIITLIYAHKYNKVVKIKLKYIIKSDSLLLKDFIRFSIPVTLNELLWGLGTSVNAAILGQLGSQVAAASSIVQVTRQLATVVAFGISAAAAIIIGKSIGENNINKAKFYSKKCIQLSIILGCIGGLIVLIVRPISMKYLNISDDARSYLSVMMFVMSYFVICQSFNTTMIVGIFRAGGDTRYGLFVDATTMWCFSILLGFIAAFVLKLSIPIVYIILLSDEVFKIPLCIIRYKSCAWLNNVTR